MHWPDAGDEAMDHDQSTNECQYRQGNSTSEIGSMDQHICIVGNQADSGQAMAHQPAIEGDHRRF